MSTVYLHLGMPKTGTTALQRFFAENQKTLNERGFAYPIMPFSFDTIAKVRNGHFLIRWKKKQDYPEWEQGFSIVKQAAEEYDNILLSDEQLWSTQRRKGFWKSLKHGFSEIGADIKVIIYLRRQDEQVESHWNQKVKEPKNHMKETFSEYLEKGMHDYMPFHYDEGLNRIAKRIGKENLIVRVYEKQQFVGGSIFADFLSSIGLSLDSSFTLPEYTANVRLPGNAVEIKRMINSLYPEDVPDFYYDAISEAYGMNRMKDVPVKKTSMFSPEQRAGFMKEYEEGNAYVAREYLGRKDGILFYGDYNTEQWKLDERQMLLDVIRVLCSADIYLFRRQDKIIKELRELSDSLPGRIYKRFRKK